MKKVDTEKKLPYVKIGGKKLFKIDDINQLIEKNYTTYQHLILDKLDG